MKDVVVLKQSQGVVVSELGSSSDGVEFRDVSTCYRVVDVYTKLKLVMGPSKGIVIEVVCLDQEEALGFILMTC